MAVAAGGDEAVGDTLIGYRLLAAARSCCHAAFVDDGAEAWGCPLAREAVLVVATVHVGARAVGGVCQLTVDALLDTCCALGQSRHQKQQPAKDHGGLATVTVPKPGRGLLGPPGTAE